MGIDNTYGTLGSRPGVCTSTSRPGSPYDGQIIYETDTNTLAVYDGTSWTSLNPVDRDRNVIINGSMQVAQRGTSFSFPTGSGSRFFSVDRFDTEDYRWSSGSNITVSQDTSVVPTGFRASAKIATGATGLTFNTGGTLFLRTRVEGHNMQPHHSKTMTLSFWVRSSVTGTYNLFLENGIWGTGTTTRAFAPEYTINAANTWEKKTITVDMSSATSSGTWNTTNGIGLGISWMLGGHSDRTGNSYKSGWTTYSSLHIQTSTAVQWATNANATFYLTGVQLEPGAVATPFEFEDYATTLMKCQRYCQKFGGNLANERLATCFVTNSTSIYGAFPLRTTFRANPTHSRVGTIQMTMPGVVANSVTASADSTMGRDVAELSFTINADATNFVVGRTCFVTALDTSSYILLSAEL